MGHEVEPNTSTGIWIGEDDVELFEEFDAYFETHGRGTYSRGERIKEAMRIYPTVHEVIREHHPKDPEEMSAPEQRSLVYSLLSSAYERADDE